METSTSLCSLLKKPWALIGDPFKRWRFQEMRGEQVSRPPPVVISCQKILDGRGNAQTLMR